MNELYEALKGYTDLPIALAAFVLGLLAKKKKAPRGWALLLVTVGAAALVGALFHIFALPTPLRKFFRVVMHVLLYEAIFLFTVLFAEYLHKDHDLDLKHLRIMEAVLLVCSAAAVILLDKYDMMIFVLFAAACVAIFVICIIGAKKIPLKAGCLFAVLPVLLLLQGFSDVIPYAVVTEHIIITAALIIIYFIALD